MKRILAASALVSLSVAGLSQAATFTPSTQTSEAQGIHGPVAVEVVFSDNAIKSVKVTKQSETQGIGSVAVEQLPKKIVELQSTQLDGVTGASITSKAIFTAVNNCIRAAGGDPAALVPVQVKKSSAKKTYYTDMVVVGGGGSGMSASIRGRYNGLNVILVEKMPYIGGAAAISGGQVVAQGSKLQKAFGVTDDSVESMMQDFLANGHNLNDKGKLRLYAENVGQTIDWLHDDVGVKIIPNDLPYLAEYSHRRAVEFEGGAKTMAQHLREVISKNGTQVLFNTRVNDLITDLNGRVIGVKATANDGTEVTIRAKATLLTTGGFGNNKQMLQEPIRSTLYYGPVSSTGDGHRLAMNLGADTQLMAYGKRYPNGIEVAPGIAKSTIYANVGAFDQAGILVDVKGNRFVNEKASNRHILDPMLETANGQGYVFMDQKSWEGFYKRLPETGVSHEDADKYLAAEKTPLFVKGATLEEVAAKAGIDAKNLAKTVARYNGFVRAGKDGDFDRPVQYMKAEIATEGPYYIVEQKPRFATTMGGLKTNDQLNVINAKGQTIPGLYAAGELVGGVMGDDSPAGANVGWALTSGRVAADAIKRALTK
ncbi:MAG: FAD-dependent oxidoreductase [Sutterellaceae bacterium]|nr:FAD-dependent oxidoreductase [Sutterellaceae bacterium]